MMSLAGIKQEIGLVLRQIDERLLEAKARQSAGTPRESVEATAELAFLKRQKMGLEHRLAELDRLPEGRGERMRLGSREEAGIIERRLMEWAVHR